MAEPKKKLSKTRTHQRRAQYKVDAPTFVICSNCQKPILPHRVCPNCGFYKNVSVIKSAPTKRIILDKES